MSKDFYKDLNNVHDEIKKFLENYCKSKILQDFFINQFTSFVYGNIINNFFSNLNQNNIIEYKLPKGKIGKIKNKYAEIQNDLKLAISFSTRDKIIDEKYYNDFKSSIDKDFPDFIKIILEIENEINIKNIKKFIREKKQEIKKIGKSKEDFNALFITSAIEVYIEKEKCLPIDRKFDKIIKILIKESLPKISKNLMKTLKQNSKEMLQNQREILEKFEKRLQKKWEEPLNLFECLIRVSLESVELHSSKFSKLIISTNNHKIDALLKIHARSLQIANEILVQLKAGYADGANARWRSIHELAIISIFLFDERNEISERFLKHDITKRYKESNDYKNYYKKLGYPPLGRKEFNKLKRQHDQLINTYGSNFEYRRGYEWIPSNIMQNPSFKKLEEHVNLEKLRPFYNLACNSIHGGSRGFYRLGLMDKWQNKILLIGPSNYGLADPLQNTAISLMHITNCILSVEPNFESLLNMHIISNYVNSIGEKAVKIQDNIKIEQLKHETKKESKFK